jgi:hypothetical protein
LRRIDCVTAYPLVRSAMNIGAMNVSAMPAGSLPLAIAGTL